MSNKTILCNEYLRGFDKNESLRFLRTKGRIKHAGHPYSRLIIKRINMNQMSGESRVRNLIFKANKHLPRGLRWFE